MTWFLSGFSSSTLPRRDKLVILSAITGVTLLAWAYLFYLATHMSGMESGLSRKILHIQPWTITDGIFMFMMWAIMMVGMMLPSASPMVLLYAGMVRKAERQETPLAPTAAFVLGYLIMWTGFSVGATCVQWVLHQTALLSPMMMTKSHAVGAGLLFLAGGYQLTSWKNVCLDHCRSPMHFMADHWHPGLVGAVRMGIEHGAFCLGCCWAIMGLLFFGGVMNLLWIAGITLFVFLEKVAPMGKWGGRWAGIGMILAGMGVLLW